MDFPLTLRHRLNELGTDQRDLAKAARVTESYISQLLSGKKAPPSPDRTDIYGRMERFLKLPAGTLAELAGDQRAAVLKRRLADPPAPLFREVRDLVLRKCPPPKDTPLRVIFERESFGTLERLVTQKLLDVVKGVAAAEMSDEAWLARLAGRSGRNDEQMRGMLLDFLETDVFNITAEHCITLLEPLIDSWDIDLSTFGMTIVLDRGLTLAHVKTLEFVERDEADADDESGFRAFLEDPTLRGDATTQELEFLGRLRFKDRRPTPLYYYRELQNLRDPIHFRPVAPGGRT